METLGSMDFKEMKQDFSALLKSLNITKVTDQAESLLKELRQTNKDLAKLLTSGQLKTDAGRCRRIHGRPKADCSNGKSSHPADPG